MFKQYYADMHIHIGRDIYHKPVKITGAKSLTLTNILIEASRRKGIDLIGVIDCHAPSVQEELSQLIEAGQANERKDGGIQFEKVTLLPGSEIEVYDKEAKGPMHVLCFFPSLDVITTFSYWLASKMKNINLSSQRFYGTAKELQHKVTELDGLFIPAHIFTPFKGLYGKAVNRTLEEILDPGLIDAIELGLSADTHMANQINELKSYTFLANSDAHSLPKIAREYQIIEMKEPSFLEFKHAIQGEKRRGVKKYFGMNPKLGKYHHTVCQNCMTNMPYHTEKCTACGSHKIIPGVYDRIQELGNAKEVNVDRPPYIYQVPLEYLPKLGPKTYEKLLARFGTEMHVIHHASFEQLVEIVPKSLAQSIVDMRHGKLSIVGGGGGRYGKVR